MNSIHCPCTVPYKSVLRMNLDDQLNSLSSNLNITLTCSIVRGFYISCSTIVNITRFKLNTINEISNFDFGWLLCMSEGIKENIYHWYYKVFRITGSSFRAPFSKNVLQVCIIGMFGFIAHIHGFIRRMCQSKCAIYYKWTII